MAARKFLNIIIAAIIVFFVSIGALSTLITDFWWFEVLGFGSVFMTVLSSRIALFGAGFLLFFLFAFLNVAAASRFEKKKEIGLKIATPIIALISLIAGFASSDAWFTVQQYLNQQAFGIVDPIFSKDVAFYVFTLPFLNAIWTFVAATIAVTAILVGLYYLQSFLRDLFMSGGTVDPNTGMKSVNLKDNMPKIKKSAKNHMSILFSFIFILIAIRYYLARYSVMYSREGIVVGAGYVDVYVFLPVVRFLMVFAVIMAIAFYIYIFFLSKKPQLRRRHVIMYMLIVFGAFILIGQGLAPALVQSLRVDPNELNLERPFIDNNIEFTRKAYGLDQIEERDFEVEENLTRAEVEDSPETIDNIRILDYRPLMQTYKQTQEIRLYYDLSGIDVDRYTIDGQYRQVMLAPRELNHDQIVDNAKTWVNLHMVYTHGFGLVMSPVNKVTPEGLPDYLIKDIPPVYSTDDESITIDEPRIYYGNRDNNYVLVNTNTDEFDYPRGNTNQYNNYDGDGGISLTSFMRKLLMTLRFGDIKLLLTGDVTEESKIMFTRNVQDRIRKIAPFLMLDRDPYIVIADGRLHWIQDAYTITGNYPYSEKVSSSINYIRNAVKVVIDAYNGDVSFYVAEEEPLVNTYRGIFPELFKPMDEMPEALMKHIRYPEDLFQIQSRIFSTYHMQDTNVFYNKEDAWEIPREIYGTGQQITMEPHYMILQLPEEDEAEYILMLPFTPLRKDNMIAWMAGRSDGEDYGKLFLYRFPKDTLVYGPSQIEARIDQDSEISQQLTLWSQQGSRVTRGNLLVIPIGNSLLYVEPLYIQSEQGQLPELKRVIVSDGNRVVMEETLSKSLDALFGEAAEDDGGDVADDETIIEETLLERANELYENILESMRNNDWMAFGESFDELGDVIGQME
ncbi:MAG: UPF0182 family protein [Nanoarchaeota archaeon]